ncbi:MAG: biotin/lipoate A/B protein ligase family protein [Anaerolineae bacterium]
MRQWRLIDDKHTAGGRNMAVDEAIMRAVGAGLQPPTLRLYGWEPPCLSLGYGQHWREVDREALHTRGWGLVRRPTGGRAILHIDELTYSLSLPIDHPLARGSVIDSYRAISAALVATLRRLGAAPNADAQSKADSSAAPTPVCFDTPSHYEITVKGRKLIGSAQTRRAGGLLQHGTLPLIGDIGRICDVLTFANEDERSRMRGMVRAQAITLEEALGYSLSWTRAAEAMVQAFAETFEIVLVPSALSAEEIESAARLEANLYKNDEWTLRR